MDMLIYSHSRGVSAESSLSLKTAKFHAREIIRFYSIKEIKNTFTQFHHADELKVHDKDK